MSVARKEFSTQRTQNNAKCKIKNAKGEKRSLLFVFHFAFYLFNFAFSCVLCG
jgi:hypothetical protein